MVAKPSGTEIPAWSSRLIISPSDAFSKADTRCNQDGIGEARFGIEGKDDPAGANITSDHALYSRRYRYLGMVKTLMHAVGDSAVIKQ